MLLSAYTFTSVASFGSNATGINPQSTLVADGSGNLYGTAPTGGAYAGGTVFEVASGSGAISTLASFNGTDGANPAGTIALDASGNLYGTTSAGGAFGYGTVFEIASGSNAITTLATFNGTNGAYAYGGVTLDAWGDLYGTTEQGGADNEGTAFEISSSSKAITTLATFGGFSGANPYCPLTLDAAGNLYGTTDNGGANSAGTVFEIASGSNLITTLASFSSVPGQASQVENYVGGVTLDSSGDLYGTLPSNPGEPPFGGALFEIAKGSNTITTLETSVGPNSNVLVDASGNILATAESGTVIELPAGSTQVTTLATFNGANGTDPTAGLTEDASGDLFGTTERGGANNEGVVFEIAAGTNSITALASFSARGAALPSGLTMDASGNFYGTSNLGGNGDAGTVFEIARGSNVITTLASAAGAEGPVAVDASGNIYGTRGALVFEIASGSNTTTTLAQFTGQYGPYLQAGVIVDALGNVYGTTDEGSGGQGSVFEIAKGSNAITTLASFPSFVGGLTLDASGDLFGTTTDAVFEIARGSSTVTTLAFFNELDGEDPDCLTFDTAGDLYGACSEGGPMGSMGYGTVFEIPAGSATVTTLGSFNLTNGSFPGSVALDVSGNIFGTTAGGGPDNYGTLFEIAKGSNTVTTLVSFNGTNGGSPYGPLLPNGLGSFFGTTEVGGFEGAGIFFELTANNAVTLNLIGGSNPTDVNHPLTFTTSVSGGPPNGETVTLLDASNNNAVIASGTLSGGTATLSVPADTLSVGTHNLVAVYAGDANFAASESAPYVQTVLPGVISISPSTGPATGGTTVTITGGGFTHVTAVDFGTRPSPAWTANSTGTLITAEAPPGTFGTTVDVTVVTSGGTSPTSAADQFTYDTAVSWLALGSAATWNASTRTLTVTGAATIIADPGSAEPNIVASASAAVLTIDPTTNPSDIHIGGIMLTDGASIVMSDVDASQVADGTNASNHHSDHNVLVIGTLGAVSDPTISIDSSSKLDLGDNDLIVHTGSSDTGTDDVQGFPETNELKAIEALAVTGRNVAPGGVYNGTWTGNGLTSSAAATADDSANAGYEQNILAVEQNSDMYLGGYSKWTVGAASETLGANDIIVKYTYNGDLNLDGAVDGDAATIFSTFYDGGATSGNIYAYGDLNGDGKINGNDATIFSTVYGNGLAGSGLVQL